MVSDQALLDEGLVKAMLHSGHSRVPVYRYVHMLFMLGGG